MCNTNIKHLIFILLLFFSPSLEANSTDPIVPLVSTGSDCDLAAPGNFRVTDINGFQVSLAWDRVPDADHYFLQMVDRHTHGVVATLTSSKLTANLTFPYAGLFDVTISAVGVRCPPSIYTSIVERIGPIINEIVALGYSAGECQINQPEQVQCLFLSTEGLPRTIWYTILQGGAVIGRFNIHAFKDGPQFHLQYFEDPTYPAVKTKYEDFSNYPPSVWTCVPHDNNYSNHSAGSKVRFSMTCTSDTQNLFDLITPTSVEDGSIKLCFQYFDPTIRFATLRECSAPPGPPAPGPGDDPTKGGGRSTTTTPQPQSITNPFTDELLIRFGEQPGSPTGIQLFNLNGQAVSNRITTTDQEYSIPTSTLPAGLYLLRIDAEGSRRTYKVVKAQ